VQLFYSVQIRTFVSVISCSVEANPPASVVLEHELASPNHASSSKTEAVLVDDSTGGTVKQQWTISIPGTNHDIYYCITSNHKGLIVS